MYYIKDVTHNDYFASAIKDENEKFSISFVKDKEEGAAFATKILAEQIIMFLQENEPECEFKIEEFYE